MNFDINNIKKQVWDNKKIIVLLIVLFLFAMAIRSNIVRYEGNYLFEPDAYYHARLVQEIVQQGFVSPIDPNVYYQVPGGVAAQSPSLYHYISAFLYTIISFGIYNKELLAFSVQFFPIIFGALIAIGMYFLGKEIFNNKKIGLITAFLTAVTPAFVYRTMAGAQGDNSLGFLWMVIGFLFFIRAIKSKELEKTELINSVIAGIFFALMVFTWRMNLLIPVILLPSAAFMLLWICGNAEKKKLFKSEPFYFIVKVAIPMLIFTIASYAYGENWINSAGAFARNLVGSPEVGIIIGVIGLIVFLVVSFLFYFSKEDTKKLAGTLAIIGLYLGLMAMLFLFVTEPDFFYPTRDGIGSMVGEESVGVLSFGAKYNSLIVFPIIALFAMPIGLYFFKRKDIHLQILFWFWTIITLFMAFYKLKFTFVFGLGLVAGAAIACYLIIELVKKYNLNKGIEGRVILGTMICLLIIGIGGSEQYITQFAPFANSSSYWIETMDWMQENTAEDAKFFNWWGEGHQLAFVTERMFSADNRNEAGDLGNVKYAEFNVTKSVERGYEIASKEIGADYIIIQPSNFSAGPTYEFYIANKIDNSLVTKYYEGIIRQIFCSKNNDNLVCNGQEIPKGTFQSNWHATPDEFYNGSQPIYYYELNDGIIILNNAVNESNLAKVYFNSAETQTYYKEVYYKDGLKIFEVLE